MGGCSAVCLCLYLSLLLPCRACSAFECLSLYIVRPRCDHLSRGASRAAHGAQYILKRLHVLQSLLELDPEHALDPFVTPPAVIESLNEVREAMKPALDAQKPPPLPAPAHATAKLWKRPLLWHRGWIWPRKIWWPCAETGWGRSNRPMSSTCCTNCPKARPAKSSA